MLSSFKVNIFNKKKSINISLERKPCRPFTWSIWMYFIKVYGKITMILCVQMIFFFLCRLINTSVCPSFFIAFTLSVSWYLEEHFGSCDVESFISNILLDLNDQVLLILKFFEQRFRKKNPNQIPRELWKQFNTCCTSIIKHSKNHLNLINGSLVTSLFLGVFKELFPARNWRVDLLLKHSRGIITSDEMSVLYNHIRRQQKSL